MTRDELISVLRELSMPLAPMERMDERERSKQTWHQSLSLDAVDGLLDLLQRPPAVARIAPVMAEDFEFEVTETLSALAARWPTEVVERLGPLLMHAPGRAGLIEVMGAMPTDLGVPWLRPLVHAVAAGDAVLGEDELIRLACALGELGGADVSALLAQLRDAVGDGSAQVAREIDIALDSR